MADTNDRTSAQIFDAFMKDWVTEPIHRGYREETGKDGLLDIHFVLTRGGQQRQLVLEPRIVDGQARMFARVETRAV